MMEVQSSCAGLSTSDMCVDENWDAGDCVHLGYDHNVRAFVSQVYRKKEGPEKEVAFSFPAEVGDDPVRCKIKMSRDKILMETSRQFDREVRLKWKHYFLEAYSQAHEDEIVIWDDRYDEDLDSRAACDAVDRAICRARATVYASKWEMGTNANVHELGQRLSRYHGVYLQEEERSFVKEWIDLQRDTLSSSRVMNYPAYEFVNLHGLMSIIGAELSKLEDVVMLEYYNRSHEHVRFMTNYVISSGRLEGPGVWPILLLVKVKKSTELLTIERKVNEILKEAPTQHCFLIKALVTNKDMHMENWMSENMESFVFTCSREMLEGRGVQCTDAEYVTWEAWLKDALGKRKI